MKNILVTGAKGQLASEIKNLSKAGGDFKFFFLSKSHLDITNKSQLENFFKKEKIDVLINCAAVSKPDKAALDPDLANLLNNISVNTMANLASEYGFIFLHVSTDFVFDGRKGRPYTEEDKVNPLNVYGVTKVNGEKAVQNSQAKSLIIRTSWLYSDKGTNFVKTILKLGKERDSIKVISDQFGSPTYAKDLSNMILTILQSSNLHKISSNKEILNFCNTGVCSWFDFAKEIIKVSNLNCSVIPCGTEEYSTPAVRPIYSALDNSKICKMYNLQIPTWEESLKSFLKEY